jgi:hypothetical protein
MSTVVAGPDVAIVGWIPRLPPDLTQLPAGYQGWANQACFAPLRRYAMQELFGSGNPDPPQPIGGYAGLLQYVATKEFRMALSLTNVRVEWANGNWPVTIAYALQVFPGYTPINTWTQQASRQPWAPQTRAHFSGAATQSVKRIKGPDAVTIRVTVRAKLTWFLNIAQAMCTFHFAPWAVLRLEYTVHRQSKATEMTFYGSTIPSQLFSIGWSAHSRFNMNRNTPEQVDEFITAGSCRNAPVYRVSYYP